MTAPVKPLTGAQLARLREMRIKLASGGGPWTKIDKAHESLVERGLVFQAGSKRAGHLTDYGLQIDGLLWRAADAEQAFDKIVGIAAEFASDECISRFDGAG